ncbi:MAG: hypothetical protein Q4E76_00740 [Tissierellia bacterium]|nr:hypothetical protein [Tissierellia bacterium]
MARSDSGSTRKKGSIMLMALFAFLVVSLFLLWILALVEQRTKLYANGLDGLQGGYLAETAVYRGYLDLDPALLARRIQSQGEVELPYTGEGKGRLTLHIQREAGKFPHFLLKGEVTHKKITAMSILKGEFFPGVLNQRDGILSPREVEEAELWSTLNEYVPNVREREVLRIDRPFSLEVSGYWMILRYETEPQGAPVEGEDPEQAPVEGEDPQGAPEAGETPPEASPVQEERIFIPSVQYMEFNAPGKILGSGKLPNALRATAPLKVEGRLMIQGLLWAQELQGEGTLQVNGLCIGEAEGAPLRVSFQPDNVLNVFIANLEPILQPSVQWVSKMYP